MSPVGRERQALNSIQSVLGHTGPKLASHLAGFSRLASSEEMPPHERVRSPLRHPPYRRRSRPRRGKAPYRSRGLQPAAVLDHRRGDSQQRRSGRKPPCIDAQVTGSLARVSWDAHCRRSARPLAPDTATHGDDRTIRSAALIAVFLPIAVIRYRYA
jgi:hypothetical protein